MTNSLTEILAYMHSLYRANEDECINNLLPHASLAPNETENVTRRAVAWIKSIRTIHEKNSSLTDLLGRFGLDADEGVALMCLAESLLRIPDRATADALIIDRLGHADWDNEIAQGGSWGVNAAGWALALTGKVTTFNAVKSHAPSALLGKLIARMGQPVIREALKIGMAWMAGQFVLGETIADALKRGHDMAVSGTRFSFDMLGEGARTKDDAARYFETYLHAIKTVGEYQTQHQFKRPHGISVKLSALHPRYEFAQKSRVMAEMIPNLITLCEAAAQYNIPLTIDAEEAERLQISLEIAEKIMDSGKFGAWQGLGFAVQAYQKRAPAVIDYLIALAQKHKTRFHIRLVKGAYWDSEIRKHQERGLRDFPTFTRKQSTDVSYLACAKKLLLARDFIDPVFGTHNAMTVAHILEICDAPEVLEFQRLHGMGAELHEVLRQEHLSTCTYAPVGSHDVLLGYLVRRILENGANSSFVHKIYDAKIAPENLAEHPAETLRNFNFIRHPAIRLPLDLFGAERKNSSGMDLNDPFVTEPMIASIAKINDKKYISAPIINGKIYTANGASITSPADTDDIVGTAHDANTDQINHAITSAHAAYHIWHKTDIEARAVALEKLGDLLEENTDELMSIIIREGGRIIQDAHSEIREAVDFCYYYAMRARMDLHPISLPGPTGESNVLTQIGRGVFACISPWNFPLAIFLGQITAALVAGNCVVAKPAPQTPLIAGFVTALLHKAGIPKNVFHLLPGGTDVGQAIINHPLIAGVAFTGSTASARAINIALANKDAPIIPFIAETGGQNAMIVDTSALPEQVIDDVITSAFRSAGQRCSALRILCLPHQTADKIIALLRGAMAEIKIGNPAHLETDVSAVIDAHAKSKLITHITRLRGEAREVMTCALPSDAQVGHFIAPQAWEIPNIQWLQGEVFGPILHIVRYDAQKMPELIDQINACGFGLTGGIHSRIKTTTDFVEQNLRVGNLYINRSIIGAVVGVQPFGGMGLSGTGPKAGGPHYLSRFVTERVVSNNLTAAGGNASLLLATSGEK